MGELIEEEVGRLLREKGLSLAVAESCTGGLICHRITSVAGSSDYFRGGVVAYANDVKSAAFGVREETLKQFGAVSSGVAEQMARGARKRLDASIGVATTGIAGPDGGTEKKPVGMVFVGLDSGRGAPLVKEFRFDGDRAAIKTAAADAALKMVYECIASD